MNPKENQWTQMIKASDLVKHVDLSDIPTADYDESVRLSSPTGRKKNIERISKEKSMLNTKLDEAKKEGLHESIKRTGIQKPLKMDVTNDKRHYLHEGHHRLAAQLDINPEVEIPVNISFPKGVK